MILIEGIAAKIRKNWDTQRAAAKALATNEVVISRLCNGTCERFSVPYLIDLVHQVGARIELTVVSK